jgi:hypothetical protein
MKYRRETFTDKFMKIVNRGITGLGVLVVLLSVTQGIQGIIGVIIMMVLISAFVGSVLWIANLLQGLFTARRAE